MYSGSAYSSHCPLPARRMSAANAKLQEKSREGIFINLEECLDEPSVSVVLRKRPCLSWARKEKGNAALCFTCFPIWTCLPPEITCRWFSQQGSATGPGHVVHSALPASSSRYKMGRHSSLQSCLCRFSPTLALGVGVLLLSAASLALPYRMPGQCKNMASEEKGQVLVAGISPV